MMMMMMKMMMMMMMMRRAFCHQGSSQVMPRVIDVRFTQWGIDDTFSNRSSVAITAPNVAVDIAESMEEYTTFSTKYAPELRVA